MNHQSVGIEARHKALPRGVNQPKSTDGVEKPSLQKGRTRVDPRG